MKIDIKFSGHIIECVGGPCEWLIEPMVDFNNDWFKKLNRMGHYTQRIFYGWLHRKVFK